MSPVQSTFYAKDAPLHACPLTFHRHFHNLKVREWFRKRREYMAQRISQSCEAYYETTDLSTKRLLRQYLSTLTTDTQAVEDIINMSNLEVTDPVAAHEFCKEKVSASRSWRSCG